MKYISSKENSTYKSLIKLKKKKHRDETGTYIIEGIKPLADALNAGCPVHEIFVREGNGIGLIPEERSFRMFELESSLFDNVSDTENSQGVVAVASSNILGKEQFAAFLREERNKGGNIAVLDRLQDPGNVGTIIRTAEAAGYRGIILMKGTADPYSPKVARAAAGTLFRMPLMQAEDERDVVDIAGRLGKKLVVSCPEGATDCFETDLSSDIALVIGNEGRGASEEFIEKADIRVKIPMEGKIESLNAAVAAGILMYRKK